MKRAFWRDLMKYTWAVPLAAIALTLAIGSVSFAVAGGNAGELPVATTVTTPQAPILLSPSLTDANIQAADAPSPEDLAIQRARENAILDLIRERMTEADGVAFDRLRSLAAEQQLAAAKAEAELSETTAELRALAFKYLGIATTPSS